MGTGGTSPRRLSAPPARDDPPPACGGAARTSLHASEPASPAWRRPSMTAVDRERTHREGLSPSARRVGQSSPHVLARSRTRIRLCIRSPGSPPPRTRRLMHSLSPLTADQRPHPSGRSTLARMPRPQQSRLVLSATGFVVSSVLLVWLLLLALRQRPRPDLRG